MYPFFRKQYFLLLAHTYTTNFNVILKWSLETFIFGSVCVCVLCVYCCCVLCVYCCCVLCVYCCCVLCLCTVFMYTVCVLFLYTVVVYYCCVLCVCTVLVYCCCVLLFCTVCVYCCCVLWLCIVVVYCGCVLWCIVLAPYVNPSNGMSWMVRREYHIKLYASGPSQGYSQKGIIIYTVGIRGRGRSWELFLNGNS